MNIHLPAILMFTKGTRFWHTAKWWETAGFCFFSVTSQEVLIGMPTTKIDTGETLSGWWFGTMEFYDFPYSIFFHYIIFGFFPVSFPWRQIGKFHHPHWRTPSLRGWQQPQPALIRGLLTSVQRSSLSSCSFVKNWGYLWISQQVNSGHLHIFGFHVKFSGSDPV